jgi:hypothetical protein
MPGSIKIDDGSGNYTILTNAGSLGSDKTITIPNETATLATTNGITDFDEWSLNADITSDGVISANVSRVTGTLHPAYKGTGMSFSSGIWTFPSTGMWLVMFQASGETRAAAFPEVLLYVSDDNFSSEELKDELYFGERANAGGTGFTQTMSTIIDVTNTSNDKIRYNTNNLNSTNYIYGDTGNGKKRTCMKFIRLGDT